MNESKTQKNRALLNIDHVVPYNESDNDVITELKEVLIRHQALSRFGISLLHEHFPLAKDEVMVEFEDPESRTLTTKPMRIHELLKKDMSLVETQWRLDIKAQGSVLLYPTVRCVKTGTSHAIIKT